ncbi:uncharacterized protein LOC132699675 isoform X2 [Cylas formicarius]|uniref:uncharacterized protein LOC132699675 isoform X2 n=1 Tax=Cylas formicarius TaxID=197179 RepID=UPI0029589FD4|nr:uncharacterized protein LOC132699675 isoform X2 [Cylas formicarius]
MAFELILLGALIFIFIVSFCGLLQKIKQTYERERVIAERIARRREQEQTDRRSESFSEIYINPAFATEASGIFPGGPPPYSNYYLEPPPKYDDVIKVHAIDVPVETAASAETIVIEARNSTNAQSPPPYTVVIPPASTT